MSITFPIKYADSSMTLVASADENSAAANEVAMTMEQIAAGAIDQIEVGQNNEKAVKLLADKINDLESANEQNGHWNPKICSRLPKMESLKCKA